MPASDLDRNYIANARRLLVAAERNVVPLCHWSVVDEMSMNDLQMAEEKLFQLQTTMIEALRMLMQAQRKRGAQSAGGELRHEIAQLRRQLADCETTKRALG